MGIKTKRAQGTSKLYNRKCYGYDHDKNGELIINFHEAKIVRKIFDHYLNGESIVGIIKHLEQEQIKSPTGKDKWPKRSIDTMLTNEKYIGSVRLLDSVDNKSYYFSKDNHEAIISEELFNRVQEEKKKRSNIAIDGNGTKRKSKKYSSKK